MKRVRKKLSIMLTLVMLFIMLPAKTPGGIVAVAATYNPVSITVWNESGSEAITPGFWVELMNIAAEFETATASDAWYEKAEEDYTNGVPEDSIKVEVPASYEQYLIPVYEGEMLEGLTIEDNVVNIHMGIDILPDAPEGDAQITVTIGDKSEDILLVIGKGIDVEEIDIAPKVDASRGKIRRVPFRIKNSTEANPDKLAMWSESTDEAVAEAWIESSGKRWVLCILPKDEGTATITIHVREKEAVCEVTVGPRLVQLTRDTISLNTTDQSDAYLGVYSLMMDDMGGEGGANWNILFLTDHEAVWTSSNPDVVDVVDIIDEAGEKNVEGIIVVGKKAGKATITLELEQCKPITCEVTVKEGTLPKDLTKELEKTLDAMWPVLEDADATEEQKKAALETALSQAADICAGKKISEDAWKVLWSLHWTLNDYGYIAGGEYKTIDEEGMISDLQAWGLNLPMDKNNPKTLLVKIGEADPEDAALVASENKYVFDMNFIAVEPEDVENAGKQSMLTSLKLPLRVDFNIPEALLEVEDLRLYNVHNGVLKEVPSIRSEMCLHATVTELSTFIMSEKIPTRQNTYSGSSSSERTVKTGTWMLDAIGWWYKNPDGTWPKDIWVYLTYNKYSDWYHFNADGYMDTGWFTDKDGRIYYLNPVSNGRKGAMLTGEQVIDGKTYYFNEASDGYRGAVK